MTRSPELSIIMLIAVFWRTKYILRKWVLVCGTFTHIVCFQHTIQIFAWNIIVTPIN